MADFDKTQWRSYIKFRTLLGKTSREIHDDLSTLMGHHAPSYSQVARWSASFKDGITSVEDGARAGRPITQRTDTNIEAVRTLVQEDPRIRIDDIIEITNIPRGSVQRILYEDLEMRSVMAKWVPHDLSESQKTKRVEISEYLLRKFNRMGQDGMRDIVTGDETYLYHHPPESRQKAREWVGKDEPPPKVPKPNPWCEKTCYSVYFSMDGPVLQIPAPKGASVTSQFICDFVLPQVIGGFKNYRPNSRLHLHWDNARPHKAGIVKEYLDTKNVFVLDHPPYSPDLSPCDFWLFSRTKNNLSGGVYETRTDLGRALYHTLSAIPKEDFEKCFESWRNRLRRCIQAGGDYFE